MRKKPFKQGIALGAMCVLSVGIIFAADMARGPKASAEIGQAFDISGLEADAYKVSKVRVLDDGSYIIYGSARGFQSNIETAVTFDEAGDKILSLEIVSQDETGGIGTKIIEESFLSQFSNMQAPVKIADLEVKSPVTGAVGGGGTFVELAGEDYNPAEWNPEDDSPEAKTMRILYSAGLLESSKTGEKLTTAVTDLSPEEQAMHSLYKAGLLESSKTGVQLTKPVSDLTPEEQAMYKLVEAGLASGAEEGQSGATVSGTVTEVDAISGATVSSKAVGETINNGYFFLQEQIKND